MKILLKKRNFGGLLKKVIKWGLPNSNDSTKLWTFISVAKDHKTSERAWSYLAADPVEDFLCRFGDQISNTN